jgi:hypothetical protein
MKKGCLGILVVFVAIWTFEGFYSFLTGSTDSIGDYIVRSCVCLAFLLGGFFYYVLQEFGGSTYRKIVALLQIVAALIVDWHELGKVSGNHSEMFDRWTFVGGAFLVMASGIRDFYTAVKEETSVAKPQPEKSSPSSNDAGLQKAKSVKSDRS